MGPWTAATRTGSILACYPMDQHGEEGWLKCQGSTAGKPSLGDIKRGTITASSMAQDGNHCTGKQIWVAATAVFNNYIPKIIAAIFSMCALSRQFPHRLHSSPFSASPFTVISCLTLARNRPSLQDIGHPRRLLNRLDTTGGVAASIPLSRRWG